MCHFLTILNHNFFWKYEKSSGFGPHYMYHCFLDNNMPSGILAQYFRKTTVHTVVSVPRSEYQRFHILQRGFAKGFPKRHAASLPVLYALLNLLEDKHISQSSDFLLTTPVSLSLHFRERYSRVSFGRIRKKKKLEEAYLR